MLIEVANDIVEKAVEQLGKVQNDAANLLVELAIAVRKGKHIVYVPALKDKVLNDQLKDLLRPNDFHLLAFTHKHKNDFNALCKTLSIKVVCTYSMEPLVEPEWETIMLYNPNTYQNFDIFEETHVIGENLNDTKFFEYSAMYYARKINSRHNTFAYLGRMGGGVTSEKVYEQECELNQHFFVGFADSDFKIPVEPQDYDRNLGDTAKYIKNVHTQYNPAFGLFYHMTKVSEIENMIPKGVFMEFKTNARLQKVLDHDYSFYDMKCGLDYLSLRKPEIYAYWRSVYNADVDFSDFDNISAMYPGNFQGFKAAVNGTLLLEGWGAKVLDEIMTNGKYAKMLKNTTRADLSNSQDVEWTNIGKIMYNWTCAMEPRRV